jgi:hypothetical protein
MNASDIEPRTSEDWKPKLIAIGAVVGALVGVGAAYLLVQQAELEGDKPDISGSEGVKLGIAVLTLLRQVATIGEKN